MLGFVVVTGGIAAPGWHLAHTLPHTFVGADDRTVERTLAAHRSRGWNAMTHLTTWLAETPTITLLTLGLAGVVTLLLWSFLTSWAIFLGLAFAAQLEAIRAGIDVPAWTKDDTHDVVAHRIPVHRLEPVRRVRTTEPALVPAPASPAETREPLL